MIVVKGGFGTCSREITSTSGDCRFKVVRLLTAAVCNQSNTLGKRMLLREY